MSGSYFSSLLQEFQYLFIIAAADGTRGGCGRKRGWEAKTKHEDLLVSDSGQRQRPIQANNLLVFFR